MRFAFTQPSQLGAAGPAAVGGKVLGLYFSAHWCPPCRAFTPVLANFYRTLRAAGRTDFEIVFVSSDRSEAEFREYAGSMPWLSLDYARRDVKDALAGAFSVSGIPTLVWLNHDGTPITLDGRKKVVEDPQGANFPWLPKAAGAAAGSGEDASLAANVDRAKVNATNADEKTSVVSVFAEGGGLLRSDCDPQLLIAVPFNQTCKLRALRVVGPKSGRAPKNIRLFANTLNMGFDDAEKLKCTQSFTLTAAQATDPQVSGLWAWVVP